MEVVNVHLYYVHSVLHLTVGLTYLFHTETEKNPNKNKNRNSSVCKEKVLKVKDFLEPLYILCSVSTLSILTKQSLPEICCTIEFGSISWKHHSNTNQKPQDQKGNILHKTSVLIKKK